VPELPEVETVARGLRERIVGLRVLSVELISEKLILQNPPDFSNRIAGARIMDVRRRGKHLLFFLDNQRTLWCHLRMTGAFLTNHTAPKRHPHDRAEFILGSTKRDNTSRLWCVFRDMRQFGFLRLITDDKLRAHPEFAKLGPEPLEISAIDFVKLFKRRGRMIKPALLDQTVVAGVGNIYADEALFRAGIRPTVNAARLSSARLIILHDRLQALLRQAIKSAGTTVDNYAGVNGETGGFQKYLRVYGRAGNPCKKCRSVIRRITLAQRGTHFCPKCQKP